MATKVMIPALIGVAVLVTVFSAIGFLHGKGQSEPLQFEETTAPNDNGNQEDVSYSLDNSIRSRLEQMRLGFPVTDENGYWMTDPSGDLLYENAQVQTADRIEKDLLLLVKHFSEQGYTDIAIGQIQRFYYTAFPQLRELEQTALAEKLTACFPPEGVVQGNFKETVELIFGIYADDWSAVFEGIDPASVPSTPFAAVKPCRIPTLEPEQEKRCICSEWFRNTEVEDIGQEKAWLHLLIAEMSERGYGEKEIVVGELFFLGSLLDTEYCADWLEQLYRCLPLGNEASYASLKANAKEQFGVDIDVNVALIDYLNGVTVY